MDRVSKATAEELESPIHNIFVGLVSRIETLKSICVITIDENGNDEIEMFGDLEQMRQIMALAVQQLSESVPTVGSTH